MDDAGPWKRMVANMGAAFGRLATLSPAGRALELDGVRAAIVPSCPDRSVVNGVVYADAAHLEAALDRLAGEYERAGVRAWTVWVPEHDTAAAAVLEEAGHLLDSKPAGMVRDLRGLEPADRSLTLLEPDMEHATRINDIAYGYNGDFRRAYPALPSEPAHVYIAAGDDGSPASTLLTYESDGECGVYFVATLPGARGRGLAGALVRYALLEARGRGCETTSLQATARGRPVYERLGYRDIGAVQMWERRRAT